MLVLVCVRRLIVSTWLSHAGEELTNKPAPCAFSLYNRVCICLGEPTSYLICTKWQKPLAPHISDSYNAQTDNYTMALHAWGRHSLFLFTSMCYWLVCTMSFISHSHFSFIEIKLGYCIVCGQRLTEIGLCGERGSIFKAFSWKKKKGLLGSTK